MVQVLVNTVKVLIWMNGMNKICVMSLMNHPEFHVYTGNNSGIISTIWKPIDSDADIVRNLYKRGFRPVVSKDICEEDITNICGLVYVRNIGLLTVKQFIEREYTKKDILCIQRYKKILDETDLRRLVVYFKPYYTDDFTKRINTRNYIRLSLQGCLDPWPEQEILSEPIEQVEGKGLKIIEDDPRLGHKWYDAFWSKHKWEYKKSNE
jgi:hypothetical protein